MQEPVLHTTFELSTTPTNQISETKHPILIRKEAKNKHSAEEVLAAHGQTEPQMQKMEI